MAGRLPQTLTATLRWYFVAGSLSCTGSLRQSFYNVLNLKGYWKFFSRVDLGNTWFSCTPVPPGFFRKRLSAPPSLESVGASFEVGSVHQFWDLRFALADSYYRAGRIFIAGDTAQPSAHYGGYGINSGLEDPAISG
jgi:hypothetical protein